MLTRQLSLCLRELIDVTFRDRRARGRNDHTHAVGAERADIRAILACSSDSWNQDSTKGEEGCILRLTTPVDRWPSR